MLAQRINESHPLLTNLESGPKPNRSASNSSGRIAIKRQELGAGEYRRPRLVRTAHRGDGAVTLITWLQFTAGNRHCYETAAHSTTD